MKALPLLAVLIALPAISAAAPRRLNNFDQLMTALKSGRQVRTVVEYAKTKLVIEGKEEPAPNAIGGSKIEHWEWFDRGVIRNPKAYVAFSETVLIAHPRHGHVYNYVRFRVYEDSVVEITARYLLPTDFKIVMDETFTGRISNGRDKEGVSFFVDGD